MIKMRLFKGFGAMLFAWAMFIVPANAVLIAPGGTAALNSSADIFLSDFGTSTGVISDNFTFQNLIGSDTTLTFQIITTQPTGSPVGIANLTFEFLGGPTFADITSSAGVLSPVPTFLSVFFENGVDLFLKVTGTVIGAEASYDFTATVVPIPPALLLFGTPIFGLALSSLRRRRKNKNGLKAVTA